MALWIWLKSVIWHTDDTKFNDETVICQIYILKIKIRF